MQSRRKTAYLVGIGLASLAAPALGATASWTGYGGNNSWSTAANWSGNVVPENGLGGDPSFVVEIAAAGVAFGPSSTGTVTSITLTGGELQVKHSSQLTSSTFTATAGDSTVTVDSGGTLSAGDFEMTSGGVNIESGGTFIANSFALSSYNLQVNGTLTVSSASIGGGLGGTGTVNAHVTALDAIIAPGGDSNPIGLLTINGNLVLQGSNSEIAIEIEDNDAFDRITGVAEATLSGRLPAIMLLNGAGSISPAKVFTILSANSITGGFENVLNGQRIDALWFDEDLEEEVVVGSFRVNYGTSSAHASNLVVLDDFQVPEPASGLAMASFGMLALARRRKASR